MDPNVLQLMQKFNAELVQAKTMAAKLRMQISRTSTAYDKLVQATGVDPSIAAARKSLLNQIKVPPTFTPRMGGNPNQVRAAFVVTKNVSVPASPPHTPRGQFGRAPIFDEDFD